MRRLTVWGRILVLLLGSLFLFSVGPVSSAAPVAAMISSDSRDEALRGVMSLFPTEAGFSAWYVSNDQKIARLTLGRIAYWPDGGEMVAFYDGYADQSPDQKEFFRLGFRDGLVLESFPPELALPAAKQLIVLQYPCIPGKTWTQLVAPDRILVGTITANELDPKDRLQTVKVHYRLMSRSRDKVHYTAERIFKQGKGLVRMERWDETGQLVQKNELLVSDPSYRLFAANQDKICFFDRISLQFVAEPNGRQIADVWTRCEVGETARARIIEARRGQDEPVEGFERLAFVKQHVWFKLADPLSPPLRMIAQEIFYDAFGEVIYATAPLGSWHGGKWFTLPGFEELLQAVLAMRLIPPQ